MGGLNPGGGGIFTGIKLPDLSLRGVILLRNCEDVEKTDIGLVDRAIDTEDFGILNVLLVLEYTRGL